MHEGISSYERAIPTYTYGGILKKLKLTNTIMGTYKYIGTLLNKLEEHEC